MAGDWSGGEITWTLASSALIMAVFGPLTMRRYNRT
jgi:ABC-2 type transport system permease protein